MSAWWLVLAFVGGMAFSWYVAGRLLYEQSIAARDQNGGTVDSSGG